MTDIGLTIAPKSDQLNADDLIGGPLTIKVTKVSLCSEPDQPIAVNFEGDNGKPYKPCKSMRRVLVNVWGRDGNAYAGRRMTLYRDDKVQFGGVAVGGIRISHMSDITRDITMALTATRANRKPFTVKPLAAAPRTRRDFLNELKARLDACHTEQEVDVIVSTDEVVKATSSFTNGMLAELNTLIADAKNRVRADSGGDASQPPMDDDEIFPGDRPLEDA